MTPKEAVQKYQCPGCVGGPFPECYETDESKACSKHCAGTTIFPIVGRIFLGMPKGFNRLGPDKDMQLEIHSTFKTGYTPNKFNIPVWKHLDIHGNTLVKGLTPRLNMPWLMIFLGNHMNEIDCLEITQKDIEDMD